MFYYFQNRLKRDDKVSKKYVMPSSTRGYWHVPLYAFRSSLRSALMLLGMTCQWHRSAYRGTYFSEFSQYIFRKLFIITLLCLSFSLTACDDEQPPESIRPDSGSGSQVQSQVPKTLDEAPDTWALTGSNSLYTRLYDVAGDSHELFLQKENELISVIAPNDIEESSPVDTDYDGIISVDEAVRTQKIADRIVTAVAADLVIQYYYRGTEGIEERGNDLVVRRTRDLASLPPEKLKLGADDDNQPFLLEEVKLFVRDAILYPYNETICNRYRLWWLGDPRSERLAPPEDLTIPFIECNRWMQEVQRAVRHERELQSLRQELSLIAYGQEIVWDGFLDPATREFRTYDLLADIAGVGSMVSGRSYSKLKSDVPITCGDGVLRNKQNSAYGEQCDDGNRNPGDGCDEFCRVEGNYCGNGIQEPWEECDDGRTCPNGMGCESFRDCPIGDPTQVCAFSNMDAEDEERCLGLVWKKTCRDTGQVCDIDQDCPIPPGLSVSNRNVWQNDACGYTAAGVCRKADGIEGSACVGDEQCSHISSCGADGFCTNASVDVSCNQDSDCYSCSYALPIVGSCYTTGDRCNGDEDCPESGYCMLNTEYICQPRARGGIGSMQSTCNEYCEQEMFCGDGITYVDENGDIEYCDIGMQCEDGTGCARGELCNDGSECSLLTDCSYASCFPDPSECGNGIIEGDEECDDGNISNTDFCLNTCEIEQCGDGFVYKGNIFVSNVIEECDYGGKCENDLSCNNGVSYSNMYQKECPLYKHCSVRRDVKCESDDDCPVDEECVEANSVDTCFPVDGDGCSSSCLLEPAVCGNNVLEKGEKCDDGNTDDNDGCSAQCVLEFCGDGIQNNITEECDPGMVCMVPDPVTGEWKEIPANSPEDCEYPDTYSIRAKDPVCNGECKLVECGDCRADGEEECDDGNTEDGDGCNECIREFCGDGIINNSDEYCDAGSYCMSRRSIDGGMGASCTFPYGECPISFTYCERLDADGFLDPNGQGYCISGYEWVSHNDVDCTNDPNICTDIELCKPHDPASNCSEKCVDITCDNPDYNSCGDGVVRCGETCDPGKYCLQRQVINSSLNVCDAMGPLNQPCNDPATLCPDGESCTGYCKDRFVTDSYFLPPGNNIPPWSSPWSYITNNGMLITGPHWFIDAQGNRTSRVFPSVDEWRWYDEHGNSSEPPNLATWPAFNQGQIEVESHWEKRDWGWGLGGRSRGTKLDVNGFVDPNGEYRCVSGDSKYGNKNNTNCTDDPELCSDDENELCMFYDPAGVCSEDCGVVNAPIDECDKPDFNFCGDGVVRCEEECEPNSVCVGGIYDGKPCNRTEFSRKVSDLWFEWPNKEDFISYYPCSSSDGSPSGVCVEDTSCNQSCQNIECSDCRIDSPEECEDGNTDDGDGCSSECRFEVCGDAVIQTDGRDGVEDTDDDEECDEGGRCPETGDQCSLFDTAPCGSKLFECLNSGGACFRDEDCLPQDGECGEPGPEDDHLCKCVTEVEQCIEQEGGTCDSDCVKIECGNGILQFGEECDDENTDDGDGCSSDCKHEFCGDGITQWMLGEKCDNGMENDDVLPDACRTDCRLPRCGDAVIDASEECDLPTCPSGEQCVRDADCFEYYSGGFYIHNISSPSYDGFSPFRCIARGEFGCTAYDDPRGACKREYCGDGYQDLDGLDDILDTEDDEQCDDGNNNNDDGCDSSCHLEDVECGNSTLDLGGIDVEECDYTEPNSGVCPDSTHCDPIGRCSGTNNPCAVPLDCDDGESCITPPLCDLGTCDSVTNRCSEFSEYVCLTDSDCRTQCVSTCTESCHIRANLCGDGYRDSGEECDDGNNANEDGCSSLCTLERPDLCGNGNVDDGEQCDQMHPYRTIECTPFCQLPHAASSTLVYGSIFSDDHKNTLDEILTFSNGYQLDGRWPAGRTLLPNWTGSADAFISTEGFNTAGGWYVTPRVFRRGVRKSPFTDGQTLSSAYYGPGACSTCGDGVLDPKEQCDSGGFGTELCGNCNINYCGNGKIDKDTAETCDDGYPIYDESSPYFPNDYPFDRWNSDGDGCSSLCNLEAGFVFDQPIAWAGGTQDITCGDDVISAGEDCDYGGVCEFRDGRKTNRYCRLEPNLDSQLDSGVQFCDTDGSDDIAGNDDDEVKCVPIEQNGCSEDCKIVWHVCGDGNRDVDEECDEGADNGNGYCEVDCFLVSTHDARTTSDSPYCGDGILQEDLDEECDDGNNWDDDGCSRTCIREDICGNNIMEHSNNEQCDDGNLIDQDGCSSECLFEYCGDGVAQHGLGEECDRPYAPNECRPDCMFPVCGDKIVDDAIIDGYIYKEICDPGKHCKKDPLRSCSDDWQCPLYECDQVQGVCTNDSSKECDRDQDCGLDQCILQDKIFRYANGTEEIVCTAQCTLPVTCGDGMVNEGEECDKQNHINGCTDDCLLERPDLCGNGHVNDGEQCDDGNRAGYDGCGATCQFEEETCPLPCVYTCTDTGDLCDPFEGNDDCIAGRCERACSSECVYGFCGNGKVDPGEQCDDGRHCLNNPSQSCSVHSDCGAGTCVGMDVSLNISGTCQDEPQRACMTSNDCQSLCIPMSGDSCSTTCEHEFSPRERVAAENTLNICTAINGSNIIGLQWEESAWETLLALYGNSTERYNYDNWSSYIGGGSYYGYRDTSYFISQNNAVGSFIGKITGLLGWASFHQTMPGHTYLLPLDSFGVLSYSIYGKPDANLASIVEIPAVPPVSIPPYEPSVLVRNLRKFLCREQGFPRRHFSYLCSPKNPFEPNDRNLQQSPLREMILANTLAIGYNASDTLLIDALEDFVRTLAQSLNTAVMLFTEMQSIDFTTDICPLDGSDPSS